MISESMPFSKEKFRIENFIEILGNRILNRLSEEIKEKVDKENFKRLLKESIEEMGVYFDEEKFIEIIENKLSSFDEETRNAILGQIIKTDEEGKKTLDPDWQIALEDIFRKSPEKKGTNFRDQIKDPQELRGFLYLITGDERFKNDFERLISQKEKFYFRLWPPYIGLGFKGLLPRGKPRFEAGEFFRGVESYIEDIQLGKDRITFWFEENLLPDEFKTAEGKPDEERLRQVGIERKDGVYEFYLTPDKLRDVIDRWLGTSIEITKGETEINKLFMETYKLYNELSKAAPDEIKDHLRAIGTLIKSLEERYKDMIETGASKEELDAIKDGLNRCKQLLEELKPYIDQYKQDKDKGALVKITGKIKEFFREKGPIIFSPFVLWWLALGWFLPLWLITKVDKDVSERLKT